MTGPDEEDFTRTAARKPTAPAQIGAYKIHRLLGEGGMGIVYEAEQQNPRRLVALKVIRGGRAVDDSTIRMFQREVHALARLRHPGIAAIYESGRTEEGQHFFAMELVRGPTLAEWIKGRKVEGSSREQIRLRLELFRKICDAVAYAHQRGVIHRDLKPGNILILPAQTPAHASGAQAVPDIRILDFGLARITDADVAAASRTTEVGRIAGTLPYMSPEQVRGNPDEIDFRSDVYALGVILYELLTGQLPYELHRAAVHEMIRIICEQPPRPLTQTWTGARRPDTEIETILHRILEKEPGRRYQTVATLAEDIDRYLTGQPILARPPSALYTLRKLVQRHKVEFVAAAGFIFLLVGFTIALAIQSRLLAVERDRALLEARRVKLEADGFYAAFREDFPRATDTLRQALALHRMALGNDNPDLVPHLYTFAGYLELFGGGQFLQSGAQAEIDSLYREALQLRRRHLPPNDPLILESMLLLATSMIDAPTFREASAAEAETIYREVLRARAAFGDGDSLRTIAEAGLVAIARERANHTSNQDAAPSAR
jgi:non-specific serine/threonine protein kinase/serine/threonine-protein kinase